MLTSKRRNRREFLQLAGAAALAPLGTSCGQMAFGQGAVAGSGIAWSGYDEAIVVDALASPIQFNIPQESLPLGSAALDHVRNSGITAVNLTVSARENEQASAFENTRARIEGWAAEIEAHPDLFAAVRTIEDVREAKSSDRLSLIFGFQHGAPFEDDLDRLGEFYSSGLRIVQLTYNVQNRLGAGCLAPRDEGLTELGHDAVAHMDELGILLDLSHCGAQTTLDGIVASSRPASITHSGCNAVFRHPRNKDDETLRLLADRGGVVGIFLMPFLNPQGPPSASDVLAHIEHALDVCGEDHVGIGTDQGIVPLDVSGDFAQRFEAVSAERASLGIAAPREDTIPYVPDLNHPRRLETIAGMMSSRGLPDRVIEKVVGANFVRLFDEIWS